MVRVRYMGDNIVLLTLGERVNMEELINLNKEWFESVFQNIEPWSAEQVAGHKVVWVRCYRLPLTFWNKDCFSKLVGEVVSLVSIDESTTMWEKLEYAKLQVHLLKNCNAKMAKSMRINDQTMSIYIEEEHPTRFGGQCMCHRNFYDTSDSVSFLETYVEETTLSVSSDEVKVTCGGEVRCSEEEMEGGEALSANRTKVSFYKGVAMKRVDLQRKESLLFTKEETKGQKESVKAAFIN